MEDEMRKPDNEVGNIQASTSAEGASVKAKASVSAGEITSEDLKRMKRINLISFAGIVCVIYGIIFGFTTAFFIGRFLASIIGSGNSLSISFGVVIFFLPEMLYIIADILLVIGGLGLVKCKNWGRIVITWAIWLLLLAIFYNISGTVFGITQTQDSAMENFVEHFLALNFGGKIVWNALFGVFLFIVFGWLVSGSVKEVCTSEVSVKATRAALNEYAVQYPKIYAHTVKTLAIILVFVWIGFGFMAVIYLLLPIHFIMRFNQITFWSVFLMISAIALIAAGLCGIIGSILLAFSKTIGRKLLTAATWLYMIIYAGLVTVIFIEIIMPLYNSVGTVNSMSSGIFAIMLIFFLFILLLLWLRTEKVKRVCGEKASVRENVLHVSGVANDE